MPRCAISAAEPSVYAPSVLPLLQTIVPAELQRPETFAWSGPIDIGAKALADKVGYRLVVTQTIAGPSQPILVSVNMANARIVDAFEALGTAAGPRATVIVDPDRHTVEVQHHV